MSLPMIADVAVNWPPVTCMPSPESPAKRIVTASSSSIESFVLIIGSSRVVADIVLTNSVLLFFGCEHRSLPPKRLRGLTPIAGSILSPPHTNIHYHVQIVRWGSAFGVHVGWASESHRGFLLVKPISKEKYNTSILKAHAVQSAAARRC